MILPRAAKSGTKVVMSKRDNDQGTLEMPAADAHSEVPTTTNEAGPRLPTWPWLWFRTALVAIGLGLPIIAFFLLDHEGAVAEALAFAVGGYMAVAILSTPPLAIAALAPVRRLQKALDDGVTPEALPPKDVVSALRLGTRVFLLVLGSGLGVAVVAGVMPSTVSALAPFRWPLLVGGLGVAVVSAATQGYAAQWVVGRQIVRLVLPGGRLDHLGDVAHVMVWHHLALLVATLGLAWPAVAFAILVSGPHQTVVAIPMVLLFVVTSTHQVMGIVNIVARGVGHLKERMREVREGDLGVKAQIRGLDSFGVLNSDFNRMVEGLQQRDLLKETFGRYVTRQVADEILAGRVALGGEQVKATVLFSDIRGFTAMSEHMTPVEVVAFLNEYLTTMVDCVLEHGGVLDKFIGDAVLAVFGAPVSAGTPADDAAAAVACARAMGTRLDEMNIRRLADGRSEIRIGIGVHTGELVAGNIGSPKRMEYTVIGDTVNVGSRLEALTKDHRRRTLLSAATASLVLSENLVEVGTVPVRGRGEPLRIFGFADEVLGPEPILV